jgi:uncharacterized membrane protein
MSFSSKRGSMNTATKKRVLYILIMLGVIALATSIYLTKSHYQPAEEGALCDINAAVSCSLVNTSVYSELFHVPVALFGAIWSVLFILMAWRLLAKDGKDDALTAVLLGWTGSGVLFILYMIYAEIVLRALCPFCTLVHVIVAVSFGLLWWMYKSGKRVKKEKIIKAAVPWAILAAVLYLIPLIAFNVFAGPDQNYDVVAQCITEKGVNMYGSFRCGVCARERALFGDSFQYINEIECHPRGENPQTELCLEKGIEGTPTWILEPDGVEVDRRVGFLDVDELAAFAGCENVS